MRAREVHPGERSNIALVTRVRDLRFGDNKLVVENNPVFVTRHVGSSPPRAGIVARSKKHRTSTIPMLCHNAKQAQNTFDTD